MLKRETNFSVILLLGLGHGLNDLTAGYFLGSLVQLKSDAIEIGLALFLYNLLAFGGQYPFALLLEKARYPKFFLQLSYVLNIIAIACFAFIPQLSIVFAGIASAIYHVAGGTVCARQNKATNIGLFAAPGVAGLIVGGYLAYAKIDALWWLFAAACIFFFILLKLEIKNNLLSSEMQIAETKTGFALNQHDLIMILLLTVISLRSVVWNVFQLIHTHNYEWLIAIAISAFIGKIAGGWLADRVGWRLYTFMSLLAATPLITFFRNEIILFCIGIGLLQSSIPATTSMLIHSMKGKTERSIGLSFGLAIIVGAIVFYIPSSRIFFSNYVLCSITALMLLSIFFSDTQKRKILPNQ